MYSLLITLFELPLRGLTSKGEQFLEHLYNVPRKYMHETQS